MKVRTNAEVRRAIQLSSESVRKLASMYGISPTTVQKWRKRTVAEDSKMGPKVQGQLALSREAAVFVATFRRHTGLSLDDCLCALRLIIPRLTRSSLHRCFQFHGVSRLPVPESKSVEPKRFKPSPIGCFHLGVAEISMRESKRYLYGAVDKKSKLIFAQLNNHADPLTAGAFLSSLLDAVPYDPHTVLTNGAVPFCGPLWNGGSLVDATQTPFDQICRARGVEHRSMKQIADNIGANNRQCTYKMPIYNIECNTFLSDGFVDIFLNNYNRNCRLNALGGLTPWEYSTRT